MGKLTTKIIKGLPIGKHGDGDGLQLVITAPERGKWVYRYSIAYRAREMGLGDYPTVTLTEARARALEARRLVRSKPPIDPIDEGRKKTVVVPRFGEFSKSVIEAQTAHVSVKHAAQWGASLGAYASALHDKRVDAITTEDVLGVLKPIWLEKPETADRVRNRIERILDAASAMKLRSGSNPAQWRGHLDHLLPKRQQSAKHHAALPYAAIPAFVARLRAKNSVAHLAVEFLVLNAVRLSEAIEAQWSEIDLDAKLWTVPADRMKLKREHRVPLSDRACQILRELQIERRGDRVFQVSIRTIQNTVGAIDAAATVHGFRSSFRDWAGDVAHAPREIAEEALAHAIGNQTERAYRRSDALDQRRGLMEAWARYCEGEAGAEVVDLASRRA